MARSEVEFGRKDGGLGKNAELSSGFEELREIQNNFEEDKIRKAYKESIRKESVVCANYKRFKKKEKRFQGGGFGEFRKRCGNSSLPEQQETNIDEKALVDVELGGVGRSPLAISNG